MPVGKSVCLGRYRFPDTSAVSNTSPCPICGAPVVRWERYPNLLCVPCVKSARDEQGRAMRFGNETLLGTGFIAEFDDSGVWRRLDTSTYGAACWVKGRRCVANEHRFGGIVVQTVNE
jgi:hypothetical protein